MAKQLTMKNFDAFSKAISDKFEIPIEIFDLNKSAANVDGNSDDYHVSEAFELPTNAIVEYYQYIHRFDEGWACVRLYIERMQIKEILNFILDYHKDLFSQEDLLPVKTTFETGTGHFAMLNDTESLSYLEGVFDTQQSFIDVAKVVD